MAVMVSAGHHSLDTWQHEYPFLRLLHCPQIQSDIFGCHKENKDKDYRLTTPRSRQCFQYQEKEKAMIINNQKPSTFCKVVWSLTPQDAMRFEMLLRVFVP